MQYSCRDGEINWKGDIIMANYFDSETTCRACNKNIKKVNQIVCDECHKKDMEPQGYIGD